MRCRHDSIVRTLQGFQKRMSTLDVAQLAAPSVGSGLGAIGGAGVERTVDEEVGAIGAELRRMVAQDRGGLERCVPRRPSGAAALPLPLVPTSSPSGSR